MDNTVQKTSSARFCFIASGPVEWGSARMRCYWPARYLDGAVVINAQIPNQELPEADVYIWQKVIHVDAMAGLRKEGKLTFWDVCDPMWWFSPKEALAAADAVNAVVASSAGLAKDFEAWYGKPARMIPDRIEINHFPIIKEHALEGPPVKFIWYGIQANRIALFAAIAYLDRLAAQGVSISLTIMDERPDLQWQLTQEFPVYYVKWELEKENAIIAAHDISLIPPYPGPWGKVKSNNRELTAWACGLPTTNAQDWDQLYKLATSLTERNKQGQTLRARVQKSYRADQSATDWLELIKEYRDVRAAEPV